MLRISDTFPSPREFWTCWDQCAVLQGFVFRNYYPFPMIFRGLTTTAYQLFKPFHHGHGMLIGLMDKETKPFIEP